MRTDTQVRAISLLVESIIPECTKHCTHVRKSLRDMDFHLSITESGFNMIFYKCNIETYTFLCLFNFNMHVYIHRFDRAIAGPPCIH